MYKEPRFVVGTSSGIEMLVNNNKRRQVTSCYPHEWEILGPVDSRAKRCSTLAVSLGSRWIILVLHHEKLGRAAGSGAGAPSLSGGLFLLTYLKIIASFSRRSDGLTSPLTDARKMGPVDSQVCICAEFALFT
jgi:hypothetical protein